MVVYRCYRTEMEIVRSLKSGEELEQLEPWIPLSQCQGHAGPGLCSGRRCLLFASCRHSPERSGIPLPGLGLSGFPLLGPFEHRRALQTRGPLSQGASAWDKALRPRSPPLPPLLPGAITSIFFNLLEDQLVTTSIDKRCSPGSSRSCPSSLAARGLHSGQ